MNISGFANIQPYLPVVSSPPGNRVNEVEEVPWSEGTPRPSTKGAEEKRFYEYQEEPWLTDPAIDFATSRKEYLHYKKMAMQVEVALLKQSYDVALENLAEAHPDIAAKKFSITMGENGNIKIIDISNEMSDEDMGTLTRFLNDAGPLRGRMQMVVNNIMMFADHDHYTFGGRYDVGVEAIQRVLDIGKILNEGGDSIQGEWVRQIKTNAEALPVPYLSVSV